MFSLILTLVLFICITGLTLGAQLTAIAQDYTKQKNNDLALVEYLNTAKGEN
jgi:hypothetical protein